MRAMTNVIVITLCALVMFQQVYIYLINNQHKEERKDLLNRLMAKNSLDYIDLKNVDNGKLSDKKSMNPLRDKFAGDGLLRE